MTASYKPPFPDGAVSAAALSEAFRDCSDYVSRAVAIGGDTSNLVTICYIDGLISGTTVSEDVIRPLTDPARFGTVRSTADALRRVLLGSVYSGTVTERTDLGETALDLTSGCCAVVFDSAATAVTFETRSSGFRSISEPSVEKALKGGKDAFIESLRVNTTLLRRKIKSPGLKILNSTVGRRTRTNIAVCYIEGVTNPELVAELNRRLDAIDVDGLIEAGGLEEYIVDNPRSPFPQMIHTERSDKFAMNLLEGRAGLIVDGLPVGFLVPGTLAQFMKVPEDDAVHYTMASVLTLLRYLALAVTLLLPAAYVAAAMYHQEMLPPKLLLSIIESKQRVPFSVAAEVMGMLIAFELLQEAGLRLPNPVGQTIGIIGALLVGQAAIEARIMSPIAVIVVALTGISGYTMPSQDLSGAFRIMRFLLVIAGVLGGAFGIVAGCILLVYHLCTLESFGVPYLSPIADGREGVFRSLLRPPLWRRKYRDSELNTPDKRRQK